MSKRKWRWVSRRLVNNSSVRIWNGVKKPKLDNYGFWEDGSNDYSICCSNGFKSLFGFVPEPGECIKVEFEGRVIGG